MSRRSLLGAVMGTLLVASTSLEAGVPLQLTESPAADRHPTWSADGSFIVFESNRSGSGWHLYRVPSGGGEETQLSFDAYSQLNPEISPDGSKIAFVQGLVDLVGNVSYSGISVMPSQGGPSTVLVPNDGRARLHPTWSPDGSTIYFTKRVPTWGDWDVYKVAATGGPESFVLDNGDDWGMAVSPDGQTLTWASHGPSTPYNLFQVPVVNPINPVQLTFEDGSQPAYSPDGLSIAFGSRRVLGRIELFRIELASKVITRLTFDAESSPYDPLNQTPAFSQDGTRLAFSSVRVTGEQNIWVLPLAETPPPPDNLLSVEGGTGLLGPGTITLPISLASNVSTPALEFELTDVPDWLRAVNLVPRGRAAALTASFVDQDGTGTHIVLYTTTGASLSPGTGPILDLVVAVKDDAVEHDSTALGFANIVMADAQGHAVTVHSQGAVFHIGRMAGDVNGDNHVDGGDLVRLVEIILGTGAPPTGGELDAADCNDDGDHNALDIVCILDDVLAKPSTVGFAAIPEGVWTLIADEPVLGFQGLVGGDVSLAGWDAAPFQMHEAAPSVIAFDPQGAGWSSGETRTVHAQAPMGFKAFGAGGRTLPVRVLGTEIHIGTPLPAGLHVLPASPNPFARSTEISFSIDTPATVGVTVYDLRGAKVASMERQMVPAGRHVWHWTALDEQGRPLPSGFYLAVVDSGTRRSVVRLTLLR